MATSQGMVLQPVVEEVDISEEGTTARFTLPSLASDTLDRLGNIPLWKASKMFECARVTAIFNPQFFVRRTLPVDRTAFIVLANMDLSMAFYTTLRDKGWTMPVDLVTSLTGFGRSTMDYVSFIEDPTTHKKLASLRFKYASVSMKTRKSVPIDDDIKRHYSRYLKPDYTVTPYTPSQRPDDAHSVTFTVRPSDLDRNNHLNNSNYLRMCMDCASDAANLGKLGQFRRQMTQYRTSKLNAVYRRECRLGDIVTVYCWLDAHDHRMIHCDLMKGDQLSFQCMVQYHDTATHAARL